MPHFTATFSRLRWEVLDHTIEADTIDEAMLRAKSMRADGQLDEDQFFDDWDALEIKGGTGITVIHGEERREEPPED